MKLMPYLAEVVRETREDLEVKREPVAAAADRSTDTIRRFERGEYGAGLDRIVDAYAEATELSSLDLWQRAIDRAKAAESNTRE